MLVLLLGYILMFRTRPLLILKLKLCCVLLSIDIVISIKNLLTEPTMSIDDKMPNGLSLKHFSLMSSNNVM